MKQYLDRVGGALFPLLPSEVAKCTASLTRRYLANSFFLVRLNFSKITTHVY